MSRFMSCLPPMLPAEVMLRPISTLADINPAEFDAFAIGPGLGRGSKESETSFLDLLQRMSIPVVIDADGLNRIAKKAAVRKRMQVSNNAWGPTSY